MISPSLIGSYAGSVLLAASGSLTVTAPTWEGDIAAEWRPHDDPRSPVRMNPEVRFGRPAVHGISTEALWEHDQAGERAEEIAAEFGVGLEQARWALAYETSARAQAA